MHSLHKMTSNAFQMNLKSFLKKKNFYRKIENVKKNIFTHTWK